MDTALPSQEDRELMRQYIQALGQHAVAREAEYAVIMYQLEQLTIATNALTHAVEALRLQSQSFPTDFRGAKDLS